jgi:hypothetical protein
MLALAQAGFGMAEAASKPGATFLGSAAAAGGGYAKNMMQLNREADAAKRGIVKERLALAQAEASGNKADIVAASQDLNNYQTRLTRASEFKQELSLQQAKLALERVLGTGQIAASMANAAATLGLRQEELRTDMAIKTLNLIDKRKDALRFNPAFNELSAEEQQKIVDALPSQAAEEIAAMTLSGITGKTSAVSGNTSDAVRAADKIVGGTG